MPENAPKRADAAIIAAIASGCSRARAAEKAGVDTKTVWRRLQDPAFQRRVDQYRERLLSRAAGRAAGSLTKAMTTLTGLLESDNEIVKLKAAQSVIDNSLRLRDAVELARRIADVEAILAQQGKDTRK